MRNIRRKGFLGLVLLVALAIAIPNASASYTTEDFEDDTIAMNPTSGDYTYTESVLTAVANVTADTTWGTGSEINSFLFNATDGLADTCEFNYSVGNPDNTFQFKFNLTEWHQNLTIRLEGNASRTIATLNLTENSGATNAIASSGYYAVELFNASIQVASWYQVTFTFNYTDSKVSASLHNGSTNTLVAEDVSIWGAWGLASSGFSCFNISGVSGDKADVYFDDLRSHVPFRGGYIDLDSLMPAIYGMVTAIIVVAVIVMLFKSFGTLFKK